MIRLTFLEPSQKFIFSPTKLLPYHPRVALFVNLFPTTVPNIDRNTE